MHNCIKFKFLTTSISPDYFLGGRSNGVDHAFFPAEISKENPREFTVVAISKANSNLPPDVFVFESQEELENYLSSVWPTDIPEEAKETYTAKNKANEIWALRQRLNQTGEPFEQ